MLNASKEFLDLFRKGKDAARSGQRAKAHTLFRKAIEIDPYHEQVWLWLASVVENDDDRRVCFENVLALNPTHPTARKQMQILEQKAIVAAMRDTGANSRQTLRRMILFFLFILVMLALAVGASLAGLVI